MNIAVTEMDGAAVRAARSGYEALLDLPGDLLDLLPSAVYVCDAAGLVLRYNRRAAELWGRAPKLGDAEHRFCGSWRLYWPDGEALPHAQTPMAEALRSGQAVRDQEVIIERPDGSRITALVSIEALRNKAGAITGAINCFQETAGRRRAAGAAAQGERRSGALLELLEALPAAVYTTDAAGRITFYNRAAVALWGCSPELGSDKWCGSWRLYWPDGRPMPHDQCPMAVAVKENRAIGGGEATAERSDGTRVPFLAYPTPLRDVSGAFVGAVNMLVDITERKAAEARLREGEARLSLLAREVDHRAQNMLATVQAIAHMTRADSVPAFVEAFTGRLLALSRTHALLAESRWAGTDLRRLVVEELAAYGTGDDGRVRISGPALALGSDAAQALAMALHELATNAAKYGALSAPDGHAAFEWRRGGDERLILDWTESGGPPVVEPSRRGFGTGLIETTIRLQLGGEVRFDWRAEGLACAIAIPPDKLACA